MTRIWLRIVPLLAMLLTSLALGDDLRVTSFNIRYVNPFDGPNAWPLRKELVFKTIETFDPDLLGMQEVTPLQFVEAGERLKRYEMLGLPRDDGNILGERAPVLFKRDRFEKIAGSTFWLSETPEKPGSKGWDGAFPRVCSWVELRDKRADGRPIFFFNTHFDHKGVQARLESAKLMRTKIAEIAGDRAVIVTGDFNSPQDSKAYKELLGDWFKEAFLEAHPNPTTQQSTFHSFTGKNERNDHRIDWILRSPAFRTKSAEIDRTNDNGQYPSDHFPITAILEWRDR
jgi:endonuclease/exonuclease/phosphatase family metal-dependent hydrolase